MTSPTDQPFPDPNTPFGARVRERLTHDPFAWLTTVGDNGTPQPNPVWFLWDGADGVTVYNRADAHRLRHIRSRPRAALHLQAGPDGNDIVVLTGSAEIVADAPLAYLNEAYASKYTPAMAQVSGSAEEMSRQYPVLLHITIDRVRGF